MGRRSRRRPLLDEEGEVLRRVVDWDLYDDGLGKH